MKVLKQQGGDEMLYVDAEDVENSPKRTRKRKHHNEAGRDTSEAAGDGESKKKKLRRNAAGAKGKNKRLEMNQVMIYFQGLKS